jgi:hypothetical protein
LKHQQQRGDGSPEHQKREQADRYPEKYRPTTRRLCGIRGILIHDAKAK